MKYSLFLAIALLTFLSGCNKQKDNDHYRIAQSIFIEDENNPHLPIYSEWGYNTFGVYFDRTPFISDQYNIPVKIVVKADTCHIRLNGKLQTLSKTLIFSFPHFIPQKFENLLLLDKKSYDLTTPECVVFLEDEKRKSKLQVLEGTLIFKNVQKLYVDKVLTRTILSGTFNFKAFLNKEPGSFTSGRFDLGVGAENFFYIKK